jgi:hypothetical protein
MWWIVPVLVLACVVGLYGLRRSPEMPAPTAPGTDASAPRRESGARVGLAARGGVTAPVASSLLSGRVQSARGAAITGARVCAVSANASAECCPEPACTQSDARGAFVLELEHDASPTLFASHAGYLSVTRSAVNPSDSRTVVLTMTEGGAQVTGSVLDAEGGPIAGAELRASNLQGELLALGVSGNDGSFGLGVGPGTTRILARADGYSEELRGVEAPLAELEIRLVAASSIVGRVTAEDSGEPVGGVLVTTRNEDALFEIVARSARSGDDGTFRLTGLRSGRYSLSAIAAHWRSDTQWLELELAQASAPVEIVVRRATRLSGALQLGGEPCVDGSVTLQGPVSSVASPGPDGNVTFEAIFAGRYQVDIACEAARKSETLDVGTQDVNRVWNLDAGARVTGAALSSGGKPLVGAQVNVNPSGPPDGRSATYCMTDEHGEFSCAGLASGDYEVQLAASPARTDSVRVGVSPEASPRVVFRTHEEGAIRVRIEGPEGFDPATFSVLAMTPGEMPLQAQLRGDAFVFDPVPLGRYEVFCDSDPAGTTQHVALTRDGQVAELTLALAELHGLSGRVIDDAGQAVPEVWVRVVREQTVGFALPTQPVLTDDEGGFSLSALVPGHYTLDVSGARAEGRLLGVASDSRQVVVHTQSFGLLSGTLRNANGANISDFVVRYSRQNGNSQGEIAGARGSWALPSLPAGTYQLSAQAAEGTASRTVQLPAGGKVSIALQIERAPSFPLDQRAAIEPIGGSAESLPFEATSPLTLVNNPN